MIGGLTPGNQDASPVTPEELELLHDLEERLRFLTQLVCRERARVLPRLLNRRQPAGHDKVVQLRSL
jgi:hypothetical protein